MTPLVLTLSGIQDGTTADQTDALVPFNQIQTFINDLRTGVEAFDRVSYGTAESLTIASDAITPTLTNVVVDTQGAAATDDLATINNGAAGRQLFIRIANSSRQVRIVQTGNIRLPLSGSAVTLNTVNQVAWFLHDGTNWLGLIVPTGILLSHGANNNITIASDTITVTQTRHNISNEAAAVLDDLATINGASAGDVLVLLNANAGQVTIVKHATGNIRLIGQRDRVLHGTTDQLVLMYTGVFWIEYASEPPPMMAHPRFKNSFRMRATNTATVITSIGISSVQIGTPTFSLAYDAIGTFINMATPATSGTVAGWSSNGFSCVQARHSPDFFARIKLGSDITSIRFAIGLFSAGLPTGSDSMGAVRGIGFRYSTAAADSGWQAVISDGTNTNISAPLNNAIAANGVYDLYFRVNNQAGTCHFSVNNGPELTFSTGLSTILSNDLGPVFQLVTLSNAVRSIAFSDLYCEY